MLYRKKAKRTFYTEVVHRELEAGKFTVALHSVLNEESKFLAACSPLSYRDLDGFSDIWHPWFIKSSLLSQVKYLIPNLLKANLRFFKLLFTHRMGGFLFVNRGIGTSLGLAPTYLCSVATHDEVYTNYFSKKDCENSSWVLFDEGKKNKYFSLFKFAISTIYFSLCCLRVLFKKPKEASFSSWIVFFLMSQTWIIGGYWTTNYSLKCFLDELLSRQQFKLLFCIHEFHPHSRVLWYLAKKFKIESTSISHSLVSREKLWLHPTKDEATVAVTYPDNFIVNSDIDHDHIKETYPSSTRIITALSPRYSHWKNFQQPSPSAVKRILFATSLAWWDNESCLQALKNLLESNPNTEYKLRIRFHPTALYNKHWDRWIQRNSKYIEVDKGDLKESLRDSCLVIGVGTTVLEEAPFYNRPSITLTDERFQTFYKNEIPFQAKCSDLSWDIIFRVLEEYTGLLDEKRSLAVKAFGLNEKEYSLSENQYLFNG